MLTRDSRIRHVLQNPVGRDMLDRVLSTLRLPVAALDNPLIGGLKLSYLPKLTRGKLDDSFVEAFCGLINTAADEPILAPVKTRKPAWWKEAVFYQIYPRSFHDANGDGIGDLRGIRQKLPYLKELGVTALWLSPVYDSPMDDNGYDIRDYQKILPDFGNMEDFDALLSDAHALGLRLIMDLVINHTSDEHSWFQTALADPNSPERGFYFFGDTPNNWTSFFSGFAWNAYPEQNTHALHLFSKKQMDLNWENPELRGRLYEMVNWWLEKGIDGFRLDVINYISKQPGLPDGNAAIGKLIGFTGIEHYVHGPKLHKYLRELNENTFGNYDAVTVGEAPGCGIQISRLLTHENRQELNLVFSFDHLENPGKARFDQYAYNLIPLRELLIRWQTGMDTWNTLFFENHDNPRMVSKVLPNPNSPYKTQVAKLLLLLQCTLRGTPFLYQGQELGLTNRQFTCIEELRDVESINLYHELIQTMTPEDAMRVINAGSRDHARQPMPWDKFTDDNLSVLQFTKELLAFRRKHNALIYGDIKVRYAAKTLFCYTRVLDGAKLYIEMNLSASSVSAHASRPAGISPALSNYASRHPNLRAYEANIYELSI